MKKQTNYKSNKSKISSSKLFATLTFIILFFTNTHAEAADTITANIRIEGPDSTILHENIEVPQNCSVTDSAGGQYEYSDYKAICALEALQDKKMITYSITYWPSYGSMAIDSIQGIANAGDWSETWLIGVNYTAAQTGIDGITLNQGDELLLGYGPWPFEPLKITVNPVSGNIGDNILLTAKIITNGSNSFSNYQSDVIFHIGDKSITSGNGQTSWIIDNMKSKLWVEANGKIRSAKISIGDKERITSNGSAGAGVPGSIDTTAAITFLTNSQQPNGSFEDDPMLTDWAAIALSAQNINPAAKEKVKNYILNKPYAGESVTDSERRAMALLSLGLDPYASADENYIQNIINEFDGTQIGNEHFENDDIFALLILRKSGFTLGDKIIIKLTEHIMNAQQTNGSWAESVDLTAAAIQALLTVKSINSVDQSIEKAKLYLRGRQTKYGGFNNSVFSTSWAIQAISALGEFESDWYKNSRTPGGYLMSKQANDGGLLEKSTKNMRVWSTAYAIPASMNLSWIDILANMPKGEIDMNAAKTKKVNNDNVRQKNTNEKTIKNIKAKQEKKHEIRNINNGGKNEDKDVKYPKKEKNTVEEQINDKKNTNIKKRQTDNKINGVKNTPVSAHAGNKTQTTVENKKESQNNKPMRAGGNISGNRIIKTNEVLNNKIGNKPFVKIENGQKILLPRTDTTQRTEDISDQNINSANITQKTAKKIFGGAAALAGSLGLYLGWRFLQTIV